MRSAIDKYTLDKQEPPETLQDLIATGYLQAIPVDPITRKTDWVPVVEDFEMSPTLTLKGMSDIHSSSTRISSEGTKYCDW